MATYGSIQTIRELAGLKPQKAYGVSIGDGDASETEFDLPYVGFNDGYILDQSAVTTISLTTDDITVYVDDVPVSVVSIDAEKGSVTLTAAPGADTVVTADYWHSPISDEDILSSLTDGSSMVEQVIDGSLDSIAGVDFKYDGDGWKNEFTMKKSDVTVINSVTLNGSVKTLDTHYWVYYYDDTVRVEYIKFKTPPSASSLQNLVVNVDRGISETILVRLSNLYGAKLAQSHLPDGNVSGEFKFDTQDKGKLSNTSRRRQLNMQIADILDLYDRREIFGA